MNITFTKENEFEGVWIQDGRDDVHIHHSKLDVGGIGIVLGHNVDQCSKDKVSRHAVAIVKDQPIRVQHVNPETHEISTKEISPEVFYGKFKEFLASL
jgi:hypothetical protein